MHPAKQSDIVEEGRKVVHDINSLKKKQKQKQKPKNKQTNKKQKTCISKKTNSKSRQDALL